MCGRYTLSTPPADLAAHFGLDTCVDYPSHWNIAPGSDVPVIRQAPDGQRVGHALRWGLVPHWVREPGTGARLNNARAEGIEDKPSFRDAFRRRRCLIPADGFFEWKAERKARYPYYFSAVSGQPLAMAGLWESWRAPDGSILRTCAVITTGPNAVMAPVHDRMPVLIPRDRWRDWLSAPVDAVRGLLVPPPDELLRTWAVDRRVNRGLDDDAGLIAPLAIA